MAFGPIWRAFQRFTGVREVAWFGLPLKTSPDLAQAYRTDPPKSNRSRDLFPARESSLFLHIKTGHPPPPHPRFFSVGGRGCTNRILSPLSSPTWKALHFHISQELSRTWGRSTLCSELPWAPNIQLRASSVPSWSPTAPGGLLSVK